jgi:hypothetical protein
MSTFFVARATIDAAVSAFIVKDGPLGLDAATALGRELWAMNAEAVRWRYDLDTCEPVEHAGNVAAVAAYVWTPCDLSMAVLVKSLDCLHTQCCEGPVRETPLYGRLAALANRFDASGVRDTEDYARAPWGTGEPVPPTDTAFRSELTPEGEQLVIPGCERNRSKILRQLDLFG